MNNNDSSHSESAPKLNLKDQLNLETGQMDWPELQTYFARGIVVIVAQGYDLLETAAKLHKDEKEAIQTMITAGDITRANDDHALDWLKREPTFWSVVMAPWLLVQEKPEG